MTIFLPLEAVKHSMVEVARLVSVPQGLVRGGDERAQTEVMLQGNGVASARVLVEYFM